MSVLKNKRSKNSGILTVMLSIVILSSCAAQETQEISTAPNSEKTDNTEEIETITQYDAVPELDFGGAAFHIIQQEQDQYYFCMEEETGDIINDAIVRRNIKLAERFNVSFEILDKGIEFSEVSAKVKNAVNANDNVYDLVLNQFFNTGSMAVSGYFQNWTNIPYIDLSQPWYTKAIKDVASIGDNLLMLESDMVLSYAAQTWMTMYNKTDAAAFDIPDLYQIADEGKWTYDLLYRLSADVYSDVNGNSTQDEDDYYGFAATLGSCLLAACTYAGDARMVSLSDHLEMSFPMLEEHSVDVFEKVSELFIGNPSAVSASGAGYVTRRKLFPKGNILFQFMMAGDLLSGEMRAMTDEFGVLPMPKYSEEQDAYFTLVDGGADIMAIPTTAQNIEMIGAVVEAGSADSCYNLMPAYMNIALEQKGVRDEKSVQMLRMIFDSRVIDFGYLYDSGSGFSGKLNSIISSPDKIVSTLEKSVKGIQKYYEKILNVLTENS